MSMWFESIYYTIELTSQMVYKANGGNPKWKKPTKGMRDRKSLGSAGIEEHVKNSDIQKVYYGTLVFLQLWVCKHFNANPQLWPLHMWHCNKSSN